MFVVFIYYLYYYYYEYVVRIIFINWFICVSSQAYGIETAICQVCIECEGQKVHTKGENTLYV